LTVGRKIGLDVGALREAIGDPVRYARLKANWEEARSLGVIGVPTFVIGDQIFWGNDRIEFVCEHLRELRLARL